MAGDAGVIEKACADILREVGENTGREGLKRTPQRFARAMFELTGGYKQSLQQIVGDSIFEEKYSQMVIVRKIEFYSLCEHHLLPFFGYAHVAYLPRGKIIGLSKIPRIVNMFARRLQVQERLTDEIAHALQDLLQPHGSACIIEAYHMCMMMRGIQVQSSSMITNCLLGDFLHNPATRGEFFQGVRSTGNER